MGIHWDKLQSSETEEQKKVIEYVGRVARRHPELSMLHHIPNGGTREKREAAELKLMGVLAGVPDLHLPIARAGWNSLYIEMKYGDGRLQKEQKEFLKAAAAEDNFCIVCYTAEDAIAVIDDYIHDITTWPNLSILKGNKRSGTVK